MTFHEWLTAAQHRQDRIGGLARVYIAGIKTNDHEPARNPQDLWLIVQGADSSPIGLESVYLSAAEWRES